MLIDCMRGINDKLGKTTYYEISKVVNLIEYLSFL